MAEIREARIRFPVEDIRIQFGRGIMARPFVSVRKRWRMGAASSKWWIMIWGVRMGDIRATMRLTGTT